MDTCQLSLTACPPLDSQTPEATQLIRTRQSCLAVLLFIGASTSAARAAVDFQVSPAAVALEGNFAQAQLVVTARDGGSVSERCADLTRQAAYASSDPRVVTVSPTGRLSAVGNGETSVRITVGNRQSTRAVLAALEPFCAPRERATFASR